MSYIGNRASADRLIEAKGQSVTITPRNAGTYNPSTGSVTPTGTSIAAKGVVLPLSRGIMHREGSNILVGDQQLLLSALDASGAAITEIRPDWHAGFGGTTYLIVEATPLAPDGTVILWDCVIRGVA